MGCLSSKPAEASQLSEKKKLDPNRALKKKENGSWVPPLEADTEVDKNNVLGLLNVQLGTAKLQTTGNYNVTLSMGMQSFLSQTCPKSATPTFDVQYNVVLQEHGAHVLHFMVHRVKQTDVFSHKNIGVGEIDLKALLDATGKTQIRDSGTLLADHTEVDLFDPAHPSVKVGSLEVSVQSATAAELEDKFWHRLLDLVDYNDDGVLEYSEFESLMQCLIGKDRLSDEKLKHLWDKARGGDEQIDVDELCQLLTTMRDEDGGSLIRRCPITGRDLNTKDVFGHIVYITQAMDGGLGKNLQGGFRTAKQANRGWMMQMSEWVSRSAYDPGLNVGSNAAHIIVYDRVKKCLTEEIISPAIVLAMRNMYQSNLGRLMKSTGMFKRLKTMSEDKGRAMDDPSSKADIATFIKSYRGQLDVSEILEPIESFTTFNEFFYRKLKPEARPIAHPEDSAVLVSAADCRLMAFEKISDATTFWVKGQNFSIPGLLADPSSERSSLYMDGQMVIFRLAPQDYHRFHCPCDCTVKSITPVEGQLYTVNPIAVNSQYCDVFTENKRSIMALESAEFGTIQFVAIGATLVGSIVFTVQEGQQVRKGDELGYFAFGGSTCICLFEPGKLILDDDLLNMSKKSIETYLKMGVHIGKAPGTLHAEEEAAYHLPESVEVSANKIAMDFLQRAERKERPSNSQIASRWQKTAEEAFLLQLSSRDGSVDSDFANAAPPPALSHQQVILEHANETASAGAHPANAVIPTTNGAQAAAAPPPVSAAVPLEGTAVSSTPYVLDGPAPTVQSTS